MWVRNLRIGLAVFFLLVSAVLFLRHTLIPPEAVANIPDWRLEVGAWLGLVLAGWNAARWYSDRAAWRERAARRPNPLAVRVVEPAETEPNPALDFTEHRRPSANGDHR